ncbi:hypothetical protein FACS1894172_09680 [Spirochaetia bacterium]|nr:hypothetical protein FACS1894164_00630 [Spirochaetia bacterium]GHU32659.1 hypothetical protein FACS1894172_09680 [Spirochaetia bacterium]
MLLTQSRPLAEGDIVGVDRGNYKHYGIYVGDGRIVHFAPETGFELDANKAFVHENLLKDFLRGDTAFILDLSSESNVYPPSEIVRRARFNIGKGKNKYNFVFNNCEHFVRWCATGVKESHQVRNALTLAGIVGAVAVGVVGIVNILSDPDHNS